MKVLLIQPPVPPPQIWHAWQMWYPSPSRPPLGLAYLAATLEQHGFKVRIIDAFVHKYGWEKLATEIKGYSPNIVGITCTTFTRFEGFKTAKLVKEILPDALVVMGGPHVSFTAEDTLQNIPEIDVVVRGEGELTLLELTKAFNDGRDFKDIKGISFRTRDGSIVHNEARPFIENLDLLPWPARHLLPMSEYGLTIPFTKTKATTVLTSRGCPIGCIFCSSSAYWGKRVRYRTVKNVVDEIEEVMEKYKLKGIYFEDDVFTINRKRVIELCNEIRKRKTDILWCCEARADNLDQELLSHMKTAGCAAISIGVETCAQKILKNVKKMITIQQVINAVKMAKKAGIKVHLFFMYGLPGESYKDLVSTIRFQYELEPDSASWSFTTIYPGTELEQIARFQGIIPPNFSWARTADSMRVYHYVPPGVSKEMIIKARRIALRSLYFDPKFLIRRVLALRRLNQIIDFIKLMALRE
jgi:radical SAM superfamily enzyme YgiQ (UPF0313 family)